jgi:hypothetical protein
MIGDFDGSANPLWTLYGKEAKSYDESRVQTRSFEGRYGWCPHIFFFMFLSAHPNSIMLMSCAAVGRGHQQKSTELTEI